MSWQTPIDNLQRSVALVRQDYSTDKNVRMWDATMGVALAFLERVDRYIDLQYLIEDRAQERRNTPS